MPYIITTRTREITEGTDAWRGSVLEQETRTAVATLEEALDKACRIVAPYPPLDHGPRSVISESGGTITLPDGTVIEVKPLHWDELRAAAKVPSTASDGMTVVAFNAR